MVRQIDRRTFLALGAGAVAWACSRGSGDGSAGDGSADGGEGALSVVATAQQGLALGDSRNAVAFFKGNRPYTPKELRVRLTPPNADAFGVKVDKERIRFGIGGDPDKRAGTEVTDIFVFRHDFDAGIWTIETEADGQRGRAAFEIAPQTPSPKVGGRALASASPTTEDAGGVDPICTRTPPCSLHEITIADALKAKKPLVISFGTPRFCTSRTCGPVLDLVEAEAERVGDAASFVHVEVFKSAELANRPGGEAPTFAEWKLATEPWTYFVGADGVVVDRWLGALGRDELRRAVDDLLG